MVSFPLSLEIFFMAQWNLLQRYFSVLRTSRSLSALDFQVPENQEVSEFGEKLRNFSEGKSETFAFHCFDQPVRSFLPSRLSQGQHNQNNHIRELLCRMFGIWGNRWLYVRCLVQLFDITSFKNTLSLWTVFSTSGPRPEFWAFPPPLLC